MKTVYILSACRTAIGSFGGSLKSLSAVKLGETVIREALKKANVPAELIDEVIIGNVLQAGLGQNTARQALIGSGIPYDVPAMTINKVCGSGLAAVNLAAKTIKAGDAECIIAGGMENMSQAPYLLKSNRWGAKMGNGEIIDELICDGLWDAFNGYHMGITAENLAEKYGISKEEQDEFAYASQVKAIKAIQSGSFEEEIVPVTIAQGKGDPIIFDTDEYVRMDASIEKISKLKAAFKKDGTVSAGNSSGINDGAAATVIASEDFVKKHGLKPIARIVSYGSKGVPPEIMGIGPVPSVQEALQKASMSINAIGLVEANEAFAAQSIAVGRDLGLNTDTVNVNGGAIALGHPIGASGTRILVTLIHAMQNRDVQYGLATLCIGGGMGEAVIIEKL